MLLLLQGLRNDAVAERSNQMDSNRLGQNSAYPPPGLYAGLSEFLSEFLKKQLKGKAVGAILFYILYSTKSYIWDIAKGLDKCEQNFKEEWVGF